VDLELEQINEQLSEAQEAQHVLVGSLRNWEARLDALHKIAENSDASVWGIKKRQADLELKTSNTKDIIDRSKGTLVLKEGDINDLKVEIIGLYKGIQSTTRAIKDSASETKCMLKKAGDMGVKFDTARAAAVDRSRVDTPGPDWAEFRERVRWPA
jgi:chromosome segregation ATPase